MSMFMPHSDELEEDNEIIRQWDLPEPSTNYSGCTGFKVGTSTWSLKSSKELQQLVKCGDINTLDLIIKLAERYSGEVCDFKESLEELKQEMINVVQR